MLDEQASDGRGHGITIVAAADEMFVQDLGDIGLRNNGFDQFFAAHACSPAALDEQQFACPPCFGLSRFVVDKPGNGAVVIKVRM
jgi:hypothetical protein